MNLVIKTYRRYSHFEIEALIKNIRNAINEIKRKRMVYNEDIYISIPYHIQEFIGWWHNELMANPSKAFIISPGPTGRPSRIFGCNIIPAYEEKVTVFFDECHLAEIEPISIEL